MSNVKVKAASLLLAAMACLASSARADSLADEADFRFHRAATLYRQGRVEEALGEFLASNRLVRNRNVIFNIARSFEELRKHNEAYRWYTELLGEDLPEADKKDLLDAIKRLRPSLALLHVESEPPGATVYVDRKDLGARGQTPVTLALPPGKVTAMVELPGYKPAQQSLSVSIGKTSLVAPTLERIYGELVVEGEPAGFELRLDGTDVPPLMAKSGATQVLPGRHLLYVSAPGHAAQQLAIEVPADGSAKVSFKLVALPPPSGALVVKANLDGALVRVDGKEMGFTPGVIENIPAGVHTVEVVSEGREPVVQRVPVREQDRSFLEVKLRYALPRVVAAEKQLTRAQDAPASITVISEDEIRGFGYGTLSDALRSVRGFYVGSDRDYDSTGVRGFSAPGTYNNRVLVLSDGHVTNEISLGQGYVGHDFDADLGDVERIEIVRGPGSVLYGSAAFFAVINVVHKTPLAGRHGEAFAQVGTLGENVAHALLSAGGDLGYVWARGSVADLTGESVFVSPAATGPATGFAYDADRERAGHLDLRARVGELTLSASYNDRRKRLPTAAFDTVFGNPGTNTRDRRGFLEAQLSHTFAGGFGVDLRASYDQTRYKGTWQYRGLGEGNDTSDEDWASGEVRLRLPELAGNRLFVGGEVQDRWNIHITSLTPGYPYFDNGPGNTAGMPSSEVVLSGYLGDDWRISRRVLLDAAVRLDDYVDPGSFGSYGAVVNPRVALILNPYDDGTTKLLLGRAFRAPGFYERFYNDGGQSQIQAVDLHPERVTTAELEHTHQLSDEVSILVAAYVSQMESLVRAATASVDANGNAISQYQNRPGFVHSGGGEVELRWQAGPGVLFSAWYGYSLVRDDYDAAAGTSVGWFQGSAIPNSPSHSGAVRLLYPLVPQVLSVSTEAVYGGTRHTVADQDQPDRIVGESLFWNAGLSGEYARWSLRYGAFVQNLLDQRTVLPAGPEIPFPGHAVPQVGRTLRLQLSAAF